VKMGIGPAHDELEDVMEAREFHVGPDEKTTPDFWFGALEGDFDLIGWNAPGGVGKCDHFVNR
jgi:hypothetical protein